MNNHLYWRPVNPEINSQLKAVLGRKLWNHDGSLSSEPYLLDADMLPYLEGLRDAKVPGTQELIDAIDSYGEVEVWIAG